MFSNLNTYLKNQSPSFITVSACAISFFLGYIDYLTGREISFSVSYLIPISYAAWYAKKRIGIIMAVLAAVIWYSVEMTFGRTYSHPVIPVWNACARLLFFLVVVILLARVKGLLAVEEHLADTDPLTGLPNRRSFLERAGFELERCRRYHHPFTIAYVDLDNFKSVNDTEGHEVGDRLLCSVADTLLKNFRQTDIVARLGGDEFAVLLSETGHISSREPVRKAQTCLLREMNAQGWPVTFSFGVVSFLLPMDNIRDMIKLTDDLMYSVKKSGKNRIEHIVYPTAHKTESSGI
jgi:diguanylate cyclase (GGDEF)-like protein